MSRKKVVISIGLALLLLVWTLPASSLRVQSDFGFQITLPPNWAVVTRDDVREKPEVVRGTFEAAEKKRTLLDVPQDLYSSLKEKLVGGQVEYYYKTGSPHVSVSLYQEKGTLAQSEEDIKKTCRLLPDELSKISKRPVTVHECRSRQVGNTTGLYLVADSYRPGEKYVQYMVQKDRDQVLLFTATGSSEDFGAVKSEFDELMKSLKLK